MKKTSLTIAAVAVISIAGGTAGFAAELPSYEAAGLPISAVQVQALGAANAREQSPAPSSTASPHRLAASTESPDTADQNHDRDGRTSSDRNRSLHSLTDSNFKQPR